MRGDNAPHDPLPGRSGRPARAPVSRHARAAQPAAQQRVSLPVWIPGSYLVREFARHLSRLRRAAGRARPCRCEQLDKCTWAVALRGQRRAEAELRGLCLRHLGARRLPRRAARLLQRHQPVPARRGREAEPHRAAHRRRCRTAGRSPPAMPASRGARHDVSWLPTTTSWSTTRWSWAASGAASSRPRRAARVRGRRRLPDPSTASACWPTRSASARAQIAFWHGRGKRAAASQLPVPAQRGRRRLRRAGAPLPARR